LLTETDGTDAADPVPEAPAEPVAPAAKVAPAKKGTDLWAELKAIFWLILAVLTFHSLIAKPFYIPSESMMPVLLKGDRLVVSKFPYGWSWVSPSFHIFPRTEGRLWGSLPERGDIVIVTPPGGSSDYIKRVIGLPGDTIEVRGGMLVLNGQAVPRQGLQPFAMPMSANSPCKVVPPATAFTKSIEGKPYCLYPAYLETLPGGTSYAVLDQVDNPRVDDFPAVKVQAGHVFLMGDNRDDSLDSRFSTAEGGIGLVPVENLVGRALVTFWSTDGSASYAKPWTWFSALRTSRIGSGYHGEPE